MPKQKTSKRPAGKETKETIRTRILNSAEELFAERGIDGTSLREIMAHARVSISLINYHFGSKEKLLVAIFERHAPPLNALRLAKLSEALEHRPSKLENVLEAFFARTLAAGMPLPTNFDRILGRIASDPNPMANRIMKAFIDDTHLKFVDAFRVLLPALSDEEIFWRLHCLLCISSQTVLTTQRVQSLSKGLCDLKEAQGFSYIMPFLMAGMSAAPVKRLKHSALAFECTKTKKRA